MAPGFDPHTFETQLKKGAERSHISLTSQQISGMVCHAKELESWNKKINLTAITDAKEMAEKHFLDSVMIAPFLETHGRILDMGSGGGFPAIPLKLMHPVIQFTLVDSVRKKVNFLNHVTRLLGLKGIKAVHCRVEELAQDPDHAHGYDAVISRGFTHLEKFVEFSLPLLKSDGVIYALKGRQALEEITPTLKANFDIDQDHFCLPFEKSHRYLMRLKKK